MQAKAVRAAVRATLPVLAGYLFLGLAYGVLMSEAGFPFDPLGTFLLTVMINARHLFYGVSMLREYRGAGKIAPYLIFSLTDETFSVNVAADIPDGVEPRVFYFWTSLLDQFYWVAASAAGGLLGSVLTVDTTGIDFVMTALFVSIAAGQWLAGSEHRPALVGFTASAVCLALFGPDNFIIPAMIVIVLALLALRGPIEAKEVRGA